MILHVPLLVNAFKYSAPPYTMLRHKYATKKGDLTCTVRSNRRSKVPEEGSIRRSSVYDVLKGTVSQDGFGF
jgi:hypothetical protein